MLLQASRELSDLRSGDHICHIYRNDQERDVVVQSFIWQGLLRNEKVLCILDTLSAENLLGVLGYDKALPYLSAGQLNFLGTQEFYTAQGVFQVETVMEAVCGQRRQALEQGYQNLRIISEMSWILRSSSEFDSLMEYETQLNERLPFSGCIVLCLYDARRFGERTLQAITRAHPLSVRNGVLQENRGYVIYTHRSPIEHRAAANAKA